MGRPAERPTNRRETDMNRNQSRWLGAGLVLVVAACSELPSGGTLGDTNLTRTELRSLALGVSALGIDGAESVAWSGGSTSGASFSTSVDAPALLADGRRGPQGPKGGFGWPIWGPHRPGVHGTTTTTTERTTPCPQGGSTRSVTRITSVVDTVARTGKVETESTDTPNACAFAVDSMNAALRTIANAGSVITITGSPSLVTRTSSGYTWTAASARARSTATRTATTGTHAGAFTYTTSDNRSGSCQVDLKTSFDPETRKHTTTGTFCGKAVDITVTRPGRGHGHGPR